MIIINGRDLMIPLSERKIGVVGDNISETRQFKIPDNLLNHSDYILDIEGSTGKGNVILDIADGVATWTVLREQIPKAETIQIVLRIMDISTGFTWQSYEANMQVSDGIWATEEFTPQELLEFAQAEARIMAAKAAAENSATTATEMAQSASNTKTEIDTIKTHIDQQKAATDTNAVNAKASEDNAKVSETNSKTSELTSSQALADLLALLGNKVATLGDDGKLVGSQIPNLSIINSHRISCIDELITLDAQLGDMAYLMNAENVVTGVYWLAETDPAIASNWLKFGVSFVAEAGNAQTALYAENSERINGHRLVKFDTVEEMEIAVKADDDLYFAPYA